MKISARTLQILKTFAGINPNILINSGNKLRSLNAAKTILAEANVEEEFTVDFGIYDLNQFLGILNLFDDPDVTFEENGATIRSGRHEVRYLPADESCLVYPKKEFNPPAPLAKFTLESSDFNSLIKAAGVLKAPTVTFKGEGGFVQLIAHDKTNPNTNNFTVELGETDLEFTMNVKTEFITKLLAEKFEVQVIAADKILFIGDEKLYMIAADSDSEI
ncbi:MAG TPA: hypothetical protein VFM18_11065 [Methanosarcina sp.]|nr:hypothetical protein [Methanosarcina sp.]